MKTHCFIVGKAHRIQQDLGQDQTGSFILFHPVNILFNPVCFASHSLIRVHSFPIRVNSCLLTI